MAQPKKGNGLWDMHGFYETTRHTHLIYPDNNVGFVDLKLVERKNGQWFLIDQGGHFSENHRVFQECSEDYIEPTFFASYEDVREEAIALIANAVGKTVTFMQEHFSG